jgi:transcription elongation factor GreA
VTLTIVGPSESDPPSGRISNASPVGRALLGRSVDDDVVIRVPNGEIRYRIVAID